MGCLNKSNYHPNPLFMKEINSQNQKINDLGISFEYEEKEEEEEEEASLNLINKKIIPTDEFICPKCHDLIPEILDIHIDNKTIDFKCKKCGVEFEFFSKNYERELRNSDKIYFKEECNHCHGTPENNEDIFSYCVDCKVYFCNKENCKNKHQDENHHKFLINQRNQYCMDHPEEIKSIFCKNCQDNICIKTKSEKHKDHDLIELKDLNKDFLKYKEIILEKNKELLKIIKFNQTIIDICRNENNYLYFKSLINIGKGFYKEKCRDSHDFKLLFNDYNNEIKESEEIAEKIFNKKDVLITRNKENLLLNNKINEDYSGLISKIRFNQLKLIDLSDNNLGNIEFLNYISLPFLEFLNLSHNKISNIDPIGEIKSKSLAFIYFQNNEITDIGAFINNKFPTLQILRLENNSNLNINNSSFRMVRRMYENKIITDSEIENIKNDYNFNENDRFLSLEDKRGGNLLLRDFFIFFTSKSKNEIEKLVLRNNDIDNPSLLKNIQLDNLTKLDLSMNNIKNLDFLKEMKAKNLTQLFLNNNKINDLSQLKNIRKTFPRLNSIDLYSNNFNPEQPNFREKLENLQLDKNIRLKLK